MYGFKLPIKIIHCKKLDSSIWLIDGTLSDATTLGQSGLEINDNEGQLHIPQASRLKLHH